MLQRADDVAGFLYMIRVFVVFFLQIRRSSQCCTIPTLQYFD